MTDDAMKARAQEALSQAFLAFGHPHPARHIAQGRQLTEDQPIYIAAMIAFATAETVIGARQWRCFHCGDVFTSEQAARLHFGRDEESKPACVVKAGAEQGLLGALRQAEYAAADARHAIAEESTEAARAYHAQATRHAAALRSAEEAGYERGLADARVATAEAGSGAGEREDYILPCDVHLPPATVVKAGCPLATLKLAMEADYRPRHFTAHPNASLSPAFHPTTGECTWGCGGDPFVCIVGDGTDRTEAAAIEHARQCLATIGETKMVQISRAYLTIVIAAAERGAA